MGFDEKLCYEEMDEVLKKERKNRSGSENIIEIQLIKLGRNKRD